MIVLTRRQGEGLVVGDDITVTVQEVGRGQCKLSIEAPPEVAVVRGELVEDEEGGEE